MLKRAQIVKLIADGEFSMVALQRATGIHRDKLTAILSDPRSFTAVDRSFFNLAIDKLRQEDDRWLGIFISLGQKNPDVPLNNYMSMRLSEIRGDILIFSNDIEEVHIAYYVYPERHTSKKSLKSISFKNINLNKEIPFLFGVTLSVFVSKFHHLKIGKLYH
jgi:hypothetical protein